MSDPAPTFASNKDRIVWLLGEWKWPLLAVVGGLIVVYSWRRPDLPVPAWAGWFAVCWTLLALPAWPFCLSQVRKVAGDPPGVKVGVVDPGHINETQDVESGLRADGKFVPEATWNNNTTVVGPSPIKTDDGNLDFIVTRWNWMDAVGELEVRGAERSELDPAEVLTNTERVDEYYRFHHQFRRAFTRLKANVASKITEVHDATAMRILGEAEAVELVEGVGVLDDLEEAELDNMDLPDEPKKPAAKSHLERLDDQLGDLDPAAIPAEPAATDGGTDER